MLKAKLQICRCMVQCPVSDQICTILTASKSQRFSLILLSQYVQKTRHPSSHKHIVLKPVNCNLYRLTSVLRDSLVGYIETDKLSTMIARDESCDFMSVKTFVCFCGFFSKTCDKLHHHVRFWL